MFAEYIEYERAGGTVVEVRVSEGVYQTYGPYYPKPGACHRCRGTRTHVVDGKRQCLNCLTYWPEVP